MGVSTLAIDTSKIIDLESGKKNDPDQVDAMITEIVTKFNAAIETVTGHDHDGTDSKILSGGVVGFTFEDFAIIQLLRIFKRGGF